jgi:hypothetical protein
VSADLPIIFILWAVRRVNDFPGASVVDWDWAALAEDGTRLAHGVSSTEAWMRSDTGLTLPMRNEYVRHYPQGFQLVEVPPCADAEIEEILAAPLALAYKAAIAAQALLRTA